MTKWRKLAIAIETLITAVLYGLFAYFFIYRMLAGRRSVTAYAINLFFIVVILLVDKYIHVKMDRKEFLVADRGRLRNISAKVLFYCHFVSFKTGLYLFYLFMLVVSRLSTLEPGMIDPDLRTFILSVEYGILLLLPLDKFLELLMKDNTRMKTVLGRLRGEKVGEKGHYRRKTD